MQEAWCKPDPRGGGRGIERRRTGGTVEGTGEKRIENESDQVDVKIDYW